MSVITQSTATVVVEDTGQLETEAASEALMELSDLYPDLESCFESTDHHSGYYRFTYALDILAP